MTLTEQDLADVLHQVVPNAPSAPHLAAAARRRAHRTRRRRATGGALLLAALVAATPAVLSAHQNASTQLTGSPTPPLTPGVAAPGDCQTLSGCPAGTIPGALRRPLTLPTLPTGQPCPVSATRKLPAGGGFSDAFSAVGEGPVYLVGGPTISFDYPPKSDSGYAGSGWGGTKVLWTIDSAYTGPLLLRGARLDGPQQLRFDHYLGAVGYVGGAGDRVAYPDLAYASNSGDFQTGPGFRTYPSAVRLQAPGCYAIQVDGTTFSTRIVFQAAKS